MAHQDLGGGIYEVPDEPEQTMAEAMRAKDEMPSCPCCGLREHVQVSADQRFGRYDCRACNSLFNSTEGEWRRWAKRRDAAKARREDGYVPLPPPDRYDPNKQAVGEKETSDE